MNDQIAPEFVEGQAYTAGQYVRHNEQFYVFTADYAGGSFANAPVSSTSIATQIELMPDKIIQYVGEEGYARTFMQLNDPSQDPNIHLERGDYWILSGSKKKWQTFISDGTTWAEVKENVWGCYEGYKQTYCWTGPPQNSWVVVSDMPQVVEAHTQIEQNRYAIIMEAERANGIEGELLSRITQTADSITSEVTRAKANEAIIGSRVTQTADAITQEVTRAQNAENGKIDKTSTYQTADQIVTSAKTYTDGKLSAYSTITQTATAIEAYVTDNAYKKTSGITITSSGIDISGSQYVKIASGGTFYVKTGNFCINTSAATYMMYAGESSDPEQTGAAYRPFYLRNDGKIKATAGTIGGFSLTASSIYSTKTALNDTASNGVYIGSDGIALGKQAFKVTNKGVITATSGTIGGWTLGADYFGDASTLAACHIGVRTTSNASNLVFFAGADGTAISTSKFKVYRNGDLYAENGTFKGTVYASKLDGQVDTNQIVQTVINKINNGNNAYNYTSQISDGDRVNALTVRANRAIFSSLTLTSPLLFKVPDTDGRQATVYLASVVNTSGTTIKVLAIHG